MCGRVDYIEHRERSIKNTNKQGGSMSVYVQTKQIRSFA